MKYGILKVGDTVRYTKEAKRQLGMFTDDDNHVITKLTVDDGTDNTDGYFEDTTGNEHAEWDVSNGADVYWLELVK